MITTIRCDSSASTAQWELEKLRRLQLPVSFLRLLYERLSCHIRKVKMLVLLLIDYLPGGKDVAIFRRVRSRRLHSAQIVLVALSF